MKRGKTYDWIPLWVDKWIFGSTRIELEHDERAIWTDFMALASKDNGFVRANENTAYSIKQLSGMLCCEPELLQRTIEKLASKKISKIKVYKSGIIYLINWEGYRLTDRHKRRFEVNENGELVVKKKNNVRENGQHVRKSDSYTDTDTNTETNTETYINIISLLTQVKGIGKEKAKKLTNFILEELAKEFPDIDLIEQVKKKCTWWRDHPITPKSRLHSQMSNWFKLGQKWIDEAKAQDRVGSSQQQRKPHPKEKELQCLLQEAEKKVRKENPDKKGEKLETMIRNARGKTSQDFWKET